VASLEAEAAAEVGDLLGFERFDRRAVRRRRFVGGLGLFLRCYR
jgi:hypothetical protein